MEEIKYQLQYAGAPPQRSHRHLAVSPSPRWHNQLSLSSGAAYVFGGVTFVEHNSKKEKDIQFLNDVGRYIPSKKGGSWAAVNVKGDKPSIRAGGSSDEKMRFGGKSN